MQQKNLPEIVLGEEYLVAENGTSDGSQIKYYKDGYWYKEDFYGGEGEAEHLVSLMLDCSDLSQDAYVHYDRIIINGHEGCASKDFLKANETLVSFYRLYQNTHGGDIAQILSKMDYDDAIEYVLDFVYKQTSLDVRTYLADTFYVDMLCLNEDRHFNNLNLIFDGNVFKAAPIFDNGKSLLVGNKRIQGMTDISEMIRQAFSKSFSGSFGQNYRYLKESASITIDKESLYEKLAQEPDSFIKDVFLHNLNRYLR